MHGAPDNYQVKPSNVVYSLQDDAELAVRLSALSSIDRLGDVFIFEDFSNDLGFAYTYASGVGSSVNVSSEKWRSKGFSLKLVTGGVVGAYSKNLIHTPYPNLSKWGTENWFLCFSDVDWIHICIILRDGTNNYEYSLKVDVTNEKLYIKNDSDDWTEILSDIKIINSAYLFYVIKMVVDLENNKYVRLRLGNQSVDLSSYTPYIVAGDLTPELLIDFVVYSNDVDDATCYLDNVIITQNEP